MALFPTYDFNDPGLDYEDVLATTLEMYSFLENSGKCCSGDKCSPELTQVNNLLQSLDESSDEDYKMSIKYSYLTLYPLT